MTSLTPVGRITDLLVGAGFRSMQVPFRIRGLMIDVPAVLFGADKTLDLIIVADTATEKSERILQKLETFARALDAVESRRAITIVLAGPRPSGVLAESMARIARVLYVEAKDGGWEEKELRERLAVLMPLKLPEASVTIADPIGELKTSAALQENSVAYLIDIAGGGNEAVSAELYIQIGKPLEDKAETPE